MDGSQTVYILKNNLPQQVKITLGVSSDTQSVVAGGDLKEGDLIILNPPSQGWRALPCRGRRLMDWVVEAQDLVKVYKMGEVEVQALRGASLKINAAKWSPSWDPRVPAKPR